MPLPSEKISELKQIIQSHLSQSEVQDKVRQMLLQSMSNLPRTLDDATITSHIQNALNEHGVVTALMSELHEMWKEKIPLEDKKQENSRLQTALQSVNPISNAKQCCLFFQILRGKAFLDYLCDGEPLPGQPGPFFRLHVHFLNQRFRSQVTLCTCDPDFNESFLLELPTNSSSGDSSDGYTAADLLSISSPIHLVLTRIDQLGFTSLVSSHFLEWRSILTSYDNRMHLAIELYGVGTENQMTVGILEVQMVLVPSVSETLSQDTVTTQLNLERHRRTEQERLFLVYAKKWWKEYLQIRTNHEHRYVKIFAQDENGSTRPVCQYVTSLRAGRLLETPQEAAWFVALIPQDTGAAIGSASGTKLERWAHAHTVLCMNKGFCEEHAILLCCLLLGFGLDSYVCIGTKVKGEPFAWVATLGYNKVTMFWDSLTATRYVHEPIRPNDPPVIPQPTPTYPFTKIGCVFNHRNFYANCQPSDSVFTCQFDLTNEGHWKGMSADSIQAVSGSSAWVTVRPPPLTFNSLDPFLASNDMEQELQALVVEYRRDLGLTTIWDEQLSYVMGPALAAYELEKKSGASISNEEFQLAIRRCVPNGHTFKGFPVRFSHIQARRIFASCLRSVLCEDILRCRGDVVRHAIRTRVYVYPENVVSTWVMISVKYKCIV